MGPGAALKALPKVMQALDTINASRDLFKQLKQDATSVFNAIGGKWMEMQDIAFQTGRSMAMSREMAMRYDRQLMQTTKELARQYGITAKEIADFQKSYAEAVGRNIVLTKEQTAAMAALSKITDATTAAQLVDEFDKVGVGIERATANAGLFQERAKALGISPAKATKTMADNIKLAASYSFRNGVRDIEQMSMKATSLRMDMNAVMSAADKFSDIEGAIGTSAKIQMLGGSFAQQFSNPMGAMYESMADPKAFMDRIERTIEGKGRYDNKTGQVTFDPVTMMQMKAMADSLGIAVDKLTTPAMAKVQSKKVDEELQRTGRWNDFSEIEREAIRNLSRTNVDEKTGKHYVTYTDVNGEQKTKYLEELTKEELQIAQDRQMSEEGLFSDVQDIKDILERTLGRARGTTSLKENITGLGAEFDAFTAQFQNAIMGALSGGLNGKNFRPWDQFKSLSWPTGQIDAGTHANEGIWDNFFNWTGQYSFKEGGIVKPIPHASLGAIIPGDSRMGDKTPVMANAGEMVLNQREQKGLFDLLKNIAMTGLMAYGGNKLGKKMGMYGIGTNMALSNLLSGGKIGLGGMLGTGAGMFMTNRMMKSMMPTGTNMALTSPLGVGGMGIGGLLGASPGMLMANPMMRGVMPMGAAINPMGGITITLMNPTVLMNGQTIMNGSIGDGSLVEELEDAADAAADVTKNTRSFSMRLRDLSRKDTFLGKGARFIRDNKAWRIKKGRAFNRWYRNRMLNANIMKMNVSDRFNDMKLVKSVKNSKLVNFSKALKHGTFDSRMYGGGRFKYDDKIVKAGDVGGKFTQKALRFKGGIQQAGRDFRELFGKPSKAVETTAKTASKVGETTKAVSKVEKSIESAAKTVSKVSGAKTALSGISKVGKVLGRAAGPIGTALAIGGAISDMSTASSQYDAKIDEIESSGMSELEKARAKDRASKEKNASYGGSIGTAAGTAIGATLGMALGPLGAMAGGWLGSKVGGFLGKGVGSLFGGGEEKKFKKEQEKKFKDEEKKVKSNEDIIKILTSIDNKLSTISIKNIGLSPKSIALPSVSKKTVKKGIGAIAGAALGSVFGPIGTVLGGYLGSKVGGMFADKTNAPKKGVYKADTHLVSPIEKMKEALSLKPIRSKESISDIRREKETISNFEKTKSTTSLESVYLKSPMVGAKSENHIIPTIKNAIPTVSLEPLSIKASNLGIKPEKAVSTQVERIRPDVSIEPISFKTPEFVEKSETEKVSPIDRLKSTMRMEHFYHKASEFGVKPERKLSSPVDDMKSAMNSEIFSRKLSKFGINPEDTVVPSVKVPELSISSESVYPKVSAVKDNSTYLKVNPIKEETTTNQNVSIGKTDINLNVSGTIKLEGGGKSVDFDLSKLLDTPEFRRQITDIITKRINENSNSGKRNMESERNNMASQYNRSGK